MAEEKVMRTPLE